MKIFQIFFENGMARQGARAPGAVCGRRREGGGGRRHRVAVALLRGLAVRADQIGDRVGGY